MSKMNELDQAKKIREIAFSKWEAVLKVTKKIANSWARNKSDEERKLRKFLIKAKENLEISNDEYELMSEEMREYEVNKNKIKSELMKVKNKIDNKTLLKYKAMKSQTSRTIRELKIGDEVYQSDDDIRKQITAHFTTIFRCDCDYGKNEEICSRCKDDDVSFTKNINPEKSSNKPVNEKDRKLLDGEIEEKEVDEYVKKHFKKEGKSPGPDGIPYIYIFKMWTHLKKIISTLVIKSFATCDFEKSLSEGLIVFLHKNGKPPNEIKSWRPLTLLNSIFKIASGILAQRLKKIIPKITHKHQYGFVNGKNASDMVELLKKIIGEEKKEGINTVLLALDFKGAFDTVKHEAIIRALKMKKFGGKFINRVAALLAGNESKIIVNGRMNGDEKVKIRRSARQGDPLSPYLFILVLDELLERMDDDYLLKGIQIGSEKITSLAFADDNYTAITDTTEGIKLKVNKIKQTMEKFRKKTGLTINVAKSEILCNDRTLADKLKSLEEIDLKTKIVSLGIPSGVDASIENEITSRLEKATKHWAKMGLNMVEKIEVINVLIIPKVIHLMRHLKYNKKKCDEWSKLMKDFIWCNKKCTVKREILEDSWDNGGWGLSSLSVTWMKSNVSWVLRSFGGAEAWFVNEIRKELYEAHGLNVSEEVPTGPRKSVRKKDLESPSSLKESATNIYRWSYNKYLKEEICNNHQPLINNSLVTKGGKDLIKLEDLPEVDFGVHFDLETLHEINENIEILDEDNIRENKKRTEKLLARLKLKRPVPTTDECECRDKIARFTEERQSFKKFKSFLKKSIINVKNNTLDRLNATSRFYQNINMNNAEIKKQIKAANPRKNYLLNDRTVLLRQKIKLRIFHMKQDLYRMNIHEIKDPFCEYCDESGSTRKYESVRHIFTECSRLREIWEYFRTGIENKWNESWSEAEMIYGPETRSPNKMKIEYAFLRIMNRFSGLRSEGEFNTDVVTPMKKSCDDILNLIDDVFDGQLKIRKPTVTPT